jgi:hypothetical protein
VAFSLLVARVSASRLRSPKHSGAYQTTNADLINAKRRLFSEISWSRAKR